RQRGKGPPANRRLARDRHEIGRVIDGNRECAIGTGRSINDRFAQQWMSVAPHCTAGSLSPDRLPCERDTVQRPRARRGALTDKTKIVYRARSS
ncbi:hypothetical protein ALC60_01782, partial [Trachymyrmex zeteki]